MSDLQQTENISDELVRPGDWLLIAVQMPAELDDTETCHKDLLAEDFMAAPNARWNVEIRGIDRRSIDRL